MCLLLEAKSCGGGDGYAAGALAKIYGTRIVKLRNCIYFRRREGKGTLSNSLSFLNKHVFLRSVVSVGQSPQFCVDYSPINNNFRGRGRVNGFKVVVTTTFIYAVHREWD